MTKHNHRHPWRSRFLRAPLVSLIRCFAACALTSVMHLPNRLASLQQAAPPPSVLHVLPKTSALHCCDPITLSRLQTDTKNITLWENASFPVCCPSLYIFITCCGLQENWFAATTARRVTTQRFALCARPSLIYPTCCCASACVCVGCTEENKGFAGIMPLQQTKGCSKLGVAPSDTWSGLNLGAAQSGVEGWRGHCFRVIIFKSPGRAGPRVFGAHFIPSCFAGWLREFDKRSVKLRGDCVCGVCACTSVWLFSLCDDSPLPRHSVRYATAAISVFLWFE